MRMKLVPWICWLNCYFLRVFAHIEHLTSSPLPLKNAPYKSMRKKNENFKRGLRINSWPTQFIIFQRCISQKEETRKVFTSKVYPSCITNENVWQKISFFKVITSSDNNQASTKSCYLAPLSPRPCNQTMVAWCLPLGLTT